MVRHTLQILQHLLHDFESMSDNFGTLCIKALQILWKIWNTHEKYLCRDSNHSSYLGSWLTPTIFTESFIDACHGPKHVSVDGNNNHKPFYRTINICVVIINIVFSFINIIVSDCVKNGTKNGEHGKNKCFAEVNGKLLKLLSVF